MAETVQEAAESGDPRRLRRALITRASVAIEDPRCPAYAKPSLAKLILDLLKEDQEPDKETADA